MMFLLPSICIALCNNIWNKLGFSKSSHWFRSILWSFFFFNLKIKARYNKDHRFCFCTLEFSGSIGHTLVVGFFVCKMGHGWHGDHHLRFKIIYRYSSFTYTKPFNSIACHVVIHITIDSPSIKSTVCFQFQ